MVAILHALYQVLRTMARLCPRLFLLVGISLFIVLPLRGVLGQVVQQPDGTAKVTIRVYRASLKQVIRLIEQQTGLTFAISTTALDNAAPISIQVKDAPLEQVLSKMFAYTNYAYEIRNKQIIVYPQTTTPLLSRPIRNSTNRAETVTVSGVVTDGEQPLAGVSVREKGTRNGASTNGSGYFKLDVGSRQAVLQFSLIGYVAQEVALRERKNLAVALQGDTKVLSDLVIIGYDLQNRANITGAIARVEGKRLKSRPVSNVLAALQGTASGLLVTRSNGQPGKEGFNLQIRGLSSVNNSEPFVLIDGAAGSLTLLNPDDIESVSVLKDAAAVSIYGPLAAGGAVLVTTKRAKAGKFSVEYGSLAGVERPINLPKRLHAWEEAEQLNVAAANAGLPPFWSPEQLVLLKNPAVNAIRLPDGRFEYYGDLNQLTALTRSNSTTQKHNITVKGGNARHQYLLSVGHFARMGLFRIGPDNTSRTNVRFNMNNQLTKHLSLESGLSYVQNHTVSPSWPVDGNYGLLNYLYQAPSNIPVFVPGTEKYAGVFNPYAVLKDGGKRDEMTRYASGIFTLKAEHLLPGLTLKAVYSPQWQQYDDRLARRTIPLWNGDSLISNLYRPNSLKDTRLTTVQHNLQLLADYEIEAATDDDLHLLAGYSLDSYSHELTTYRGTQLSPTELTKLRMNDRQLAMRTGYTGSGFLSSYFARINWNHDQRYLLEANLVGAHLETFGSTQSPTDRWRFFPSIAAGWRINNEQWFKDALPFVDELKLRASWGQVGSFNRYARLNDYIYRENLYYQQVLPLEAYLRNNRYMPGASSWEKITSANAGIDIGLFRSRLNVTLDVFLKRNNNMQVLVQNAYIPGMLPATYNTAVLRSKGWELNVGWRDRKGVFNYWVNANIFDDNNKILRNDGPMRYQPGLNSGLEGYPYNSLFGYKASGYFQQAGEVASHAFQSGNTGPGDIRYADVNGDGRINTGANTAADHGDLVYLGSPDPRYVYGFDAGFTYKGFDFAIFFQGVGRRKLLIPPVYNLPFTDSWRQPWDIQQDYWRPDHPQAAFPRPYAGYNMNQEPSSHWLMNAAYIRLKNLQLGYTFKFGRPKSWVEQLRIYFSGQDLWELNRMKIRYYDPEQNGINGYEYPFFRSFTIGVNANF